MFTCRRSEINWPVKVKEIQVCNAVSYIVIIKYTHAQQQSLVSRSNSSTCGGGGGGVDEDGVVVVENERNG